MKDTLYLETFGKAFVPKRFRSELKNYLFKAGINTVPFKFFGGLFWTTLVITYLIYFSFIYVPISELNPFGVMIITFLSWFIIQSIMAFLVIIGVYFNLNIKIYNRVKKMEESLPDYLTLVSTNLKGGLSFEKSLWAAIKPEFGILSHEMTLVSKKVLTGHDVKDSLMDLMQKYDSPELKRSLNLIIGEVESGGKIVNVIEKVIDNLKKSYVLKQEMAAATVTYTIFMVAIVLFITPALFALAQQLLKIIIGVMKTLSSSSSSSSSLMGGGGGGGGEGIDPEDFKRFSIFAISIIASFSSMIISIISKGDARGGIKYIPIFNAVAITLFLLLSKVLAGFFGTVG